MTDEQKANLLQLTPVVAVVVVVVVTAVVAPAHAAYTSAHVP
jgi:preprotein translocase subunit Sec61beta